VGFIDKLDESNCTRVIGALVVEHLQEKGHTVNLLRVDENNNYNFEDCYVRANEANGIADISDIELYVEIHINAGGGTGPEVCVTGKPDVANQYATKVSSALSGALNLTNRGVKTRSLIVLNKTIMPAILVECLFADSDDADIYDPEVIARAIVDGLVGVESSSKVELKLGWNLNNVGWWFCTDEINKYYYTAESGWKEIDGDWYYDEYDKFWYYLGYDCKMVRGDKNKPLWK